MSTSPNPNGYIAVVFTYGGSKLSYAQFLQSFNVTLPGGGGVQLGQKQYYGFAPKTTPNVLQLGQSYPLSSAATAVGGLLPTNGSSANLTAAFANWAKNQAASPGQSSLANLYLSHYTGGRIYLSNGSLGLGSTGEPSPTAATDPAYGLLYGLFEPFIGAQVGSTTIPGNGADVTDIDWFSFPVTLKVWCYDFSNPKSTTLTLGSTAAGGDGGSIYGVLDIPGSATSPTNQYPNGSLPVPPPSNSTTALRLAGPTSAAAAQSYYTDPATDPFPYHYFDDYLIYLQNLQGKAQSLFTLAGNYAGNSTATGSNFEAQGFSFAVDFSPITTEVNTYPSGQVTQIAPTSTIVLTGCTDDFGSSSQPFTITLPWAMGSALYSLPISTSQDALQQGWLKLPSSIPGAASGTYPTGGAAVAVSALDANSQTITPESGTTILQLIFSVNSQPLSGVLDDLYQGGNGTMLAISGLSGLTLTANAVYTQACDQVSSVIAIITVGSGGQLATIQVNDIGSAPGIVSGNTWTIQANSPGLGNNQEIVITLNQNPPLRNAFTLNSATYSVVPASLSVTAGSAQPFQLTVTSAGLSQTGWQNDVTWTTLSQPAGIYGANAGYTIAGLQGSNASFNGNIKALGNDVFGWIVADLLAALNVGFIGSPVTYPATGKSIGASSSQWFDSGNNPYTAGLWGAAAWAGQKGANGKPITNFWNTWAYNLSTVPGGTNAYGFAFTDRFAEGILIGFDPPPSSPSALYPVLLEVVVGDSPFVSA